MNYKEEIFKEEIYKMITTGEDNNEKRFSIINDRIIRLIDDFFKEISTCNRKIDSLSVSVKILKDKVKVLENNDD